MIWFISCISPEEAFDTAPSPQDAEDSAAWAEEPDCPIATDMDQISFPAVPAMSNIQTVDITLSHDCSIPHVLLQS